MSSFHANRRVNINRAPCREMGASSASLLLITSDFSRPLVAAPRVIHMVIVPARVTIAESRCDSFTIDGLSGGVVSSLSAVIF